MTASNTTSGSSRMSFTEQVRSMTWNFWVANSIEAMERLAFFGVRAVLPLYMVDTTGSGLGLSYTQKGVIYMAWALFQCLIPMVSGGYTDTYGYKKSMYVAFSINILGYSLMANASGFWTMMIAALCVGTGTAIFKPPVQGAVAKSLNDGNSGLGFGIFYWIVNIGGFLAPMAAATLRGNEAHPTWEYVFYGAAVVTALNFLPALFLFREPELDVEARKKSPFQVFKDTMMVLWRDQAMLKFLLIVSGFWFMFMQLWDLLPNFIDEWVDTRQLGSWMAAALGSGADGFLTADGAAKPEMLINIDSAAIILLVIPMSYFFGRFKMMTSLVIGMALAAVSFMAAGMTTVGWICALAIFLFAIGEIICSPKFSEFIGMTAPPDKKAIYMGYSNIPFAIGWAAGNLVSGPLYDAFSSKLLLGRRYLVERMGMEQSVVDAIPDARVMETLTGRLPAGSTSYDAVQVLWSTYQPWLIWVILGAVGIVSLLAMVISYQRAQRQSVS